MKTVITIDGEKVVVTQDDKPLMVTAGSPVSADAPVGPFDQFTRPWRKGDRNPTEGEQTMHPELFLEYGKDQPQPGPVPGAGPSKTVPVVMGGETALAYPNGSQSTTRVTGVVAGLTAYSFTIPAGGAPGVGRVSITQESSGDAAGTFAFSTEKGPVVGPSIKGAPYEGNMPVLNFQVGQNKDGYGPELPTGVKIYINAQYSGTPGSNQLVQIESHNRK